MTLYGQYAGMTRQSKVLVSSWFLSWHLLWGSANPACSSDQLGLHLVGPLNRRANAEMPGKVPRRESPNAAGGVRRRLHLVEEYVEIGCGCS